MAKCTYKWPLKCFWRNIIFFSSIAGGVEADRVQQHSVPHRTIDKVEFENKSLKIENAKFEN